MKHKYSELLAERNRSFWELMIDEWIFDEVDRHLLKRRFFDNITFEDLANEVHLSTVQTKNRYYKASNKFFNKVKL